MRIGFDAKRAFSNYTGLGNYSRDVIRVLSKKFNANQYFLYTPKEKYNSRLNFIKDSKNIFIRTPQRIFGKIFHSLWRSKTIVRDLFQNKIEIYHGLSHEIPLSIEKTNIKSIVTIHDLIYIRYPNLFSKIDRKIYDIKFRSACHRSNRIIAVSEQTKKDIIQYFKIDSNKISVVYQGCSLVFQKEKSIKEINDCINKYHLPDNYLLYVGSIEERKNLLTLLKVMTDMPNEFLVVIGDGKIYKKKCLEFIKKNNLEKRIIILSNLDLDTMACIYKKANIMIYPSIFEGFGIPIIEALFSKTPVITSKGGCFGEAGGEHSIYIDPLSSEQIKEAIIEVKGNKKLRKNMIEKGFDYAQKFTDEKVAENIMNAYNLV